MCTSPVVSGGCCFYVDIRHLYRGPLIIFPSPLLSEKFPEPRPGVGRGMIKRSHLLLSAPKFITLHIFQLWVSVLIPINYIKNLLC